tara:strand:+ start:2261 stop:2455 length:195 start_codon:yes stop_codon:yes gene_type:complete
MFQVGDLVRIKYGFTDSDSNEFDWIGMILSYRGKSGLDNEDEWIVQWAHAAHEAVEYGYYLEVI